MRKIAFLTGSSKGMGLSTTRALLSCGWWVFGFSRSESGVKHDRYKHSAVDLRDASSTQKLFQELVEPLQAEKFSRIALINNAAVLHPVGPLDQHSLSDLSEAFCINTAVPMWLSHFLFSRFPDCPAVVVQISSGAATKAYPGWGFYCASKAALRMASFALAEELKLLNRRSPTAVVIYAPGVVDTGMQKQVRDEKPEAFPLVDRFKQLHQTGQLLAPEAPAQEIQALCDMKLDRDMLIEERFPADSLKQNP